jgi:hypothetical protein
MIVFLQCNSFIGKASKQPTILFCQQLVSTFDYIVLNEKGIKDRDIGGLNF